MKQAVKVILISCAGLLFASAVLQVPLFSSLQNKLYDSLFHARGPLQDKGDVVIVAIDQASLQKTGDWPWPRSVLAGLIEKIKQGGPKVIGIDLLLDVPSKGDTVDGDARLAQALSIPPVCVLPAVAQDETLLFAPLDIFRTGYTRIGAVNLEADPADKITREFKAMYHAMPSFPLAVCLEYFGLSLKDIKAQDSSLEIPGHLIPRQALINFKCANIGAFSASDVLEPFFDPGLFFKGKIVLLGRTDTASKDFVNTPVPSGKLFGTLPMAGVELWKEIIGMIVENNFLYSLPALVSLLIALALSLVVCNLSLGSNKRGAVVAVFSIGLCGAAFYYLFLTKNIVLPVVYFVLSCATAYLFSFLYNFTMFQREKRKITAAFKSYISPQLLQNILGRKIDLSVGAQRKDLTMLFADIKGFTVFSDTHGPDEVLAFLKAFFGEMNQAIISRNGIVNKLMGDGILAFFGDFTDADTHVDDAVRAAVEMQKRIPGLQKKLGYGLQIRIGVHTGPVDVGNIGSSEHLDYTVIGRNVNLAQRLEANCEPGKVLISDEVYRKVKGTVEVSDTRKIPLKGFADTVTVHTIEPLGVSEAAREKVSQ